MASRQQQRFTRNVSSSPSPSPFRVTRVMATATALLCVATLAVTLAALSSSATERHALLPAMLAFNMRATFSWLRGASSTVSQSMTPSIRRRSADSSLGGVLSGGALSTNVIAGAGVYNETTALYLAHVTSVSYCQEPHVRNWSCGPCALVPRMDAVKVVHDTKDNFQGLVGYSALYNAIVVAFRGSMDITNWIDNITFIKKRAYNDYPNVKVHQGFYWVYRSVAKQLVPDVKKLMEVYPNASVMVTGHSLGAAVAAICTFELEFLEKIKVEALYTFGEPRVGNSDFSSILHNSSIDVFRVTHFRDVVPHLPPTWIGFQHTRREVFYDEFQSSYTLCNDTFGEDPSCSDACSPFGCTSVVDHLTYLNVTMSHLIC